MEKIRKPATEQILDWFERNPTSKARSGPLAKALKMDSTQCAEALARLSQPGKPLMRAKVEVGAAERAQGAAKEQWEYWLALSGKAPEPMKPYQAPKVFRRDTASPPSPSHSQLPPTSLAERAGRLEDIVDTQKAQLQQAIERTETLEAQLRETQIACAEWQRKYEKSLAERDEERVDGASKLADAEARNQQLEQELAKPTTTAILEVRQPAGYVVATPHKALQRVKLEKNALRLAMSGAKSQGVAEVFALYPAGKAVRGAEWRPKSW